MIQLRPSLQQLAAPPGHRVLLFRAGALGDTILLLPTLRLMARKLPSVRLTLIGSNWARKLRPLTPGEWDFYPFDSPGLARLFTDTPGAVPEPVRSASAAVLYTSSPHDALVRNVDRAVRGRALCWPVEPSGRRHAAAHFAGAVGTGPVPLSELPRADLLAGDEEREAAGRWLKTIAAPAGRPLVLIHPGSGSARKCWPADRFAALARWLLDHRYGVVVLEGPADEQAREQLLLRLPGLPVFRRENLLSVAGLLGEVDTCVTNDSGVGHLAAALGTPTVSVFGPTDPAIWRPLGPRMLPVRGAAPNWPSVAEVRRAVCRLIS